MNGPASERTAITGESPGRASFSNLLWVPTYETGRGWSAPSADLCLTYDRPTPPTCLPAWARWPRGHGYY